MDTVNDSDPDKGIRDTILNAGLQRALKIDLGTTWWSTRLYLTSALAERLAHVRRIVIAQKNEFVGLLSTKRIISALAAMHPILSSVSNKLAQRRAVLADVNAEMKAVFDLWTAAIGGPKSRQNEDEAKVVLTPELLRTLFGDAMLQQPVYVSDLARATVIDLLRILDYPSEFVPVVSRRTGPATQAGTTAEPPKDPIQVVDKSALNAQLAQSYVTELMDRARISG
jgi:hypothetical protein